MSTAPISEKMLTAEEYMNLPEDGRFTELVRGRIVEMSRPQFRHGVVCSRLDRQVGGFVEEQDIGHTTSNDNGFITERNPDSVRGADIAFYSYDRVPKGVWPDGYPAVPNAAFEVRSPNDRWKDIHAKIVEYLNAGVEVVCIIDPERQSITVFRPDQPPVFFNVNDELILPDVLPGFRMSLQRLFSP